MAIYTVQWCFQGPSGSPDDRYCNTWHININGAGADSFDWAEPFNGSASGFGGAMLAAFHQFYHRLNFADVLAPAVYTPGATFKVYRLSDTSPRTPVYSFMWPGNPFTAATTVLGLPTEVAICLSFEAIQTATGNRARRRGRVYLGPLTRATLSDLTAGPETRVEATTQADIISSFKLFWADLVELDTVQGVYSPTDDLFLASQTAWVDDAFDIQRRRGVKSFGRYNTTRTLDAWD